MLTGAEIWHYLQDEMGDAQDPDGQDEALRWWSEGQSRLQRYSELNTTIGWAAGDTQVDLPAGFIQVVRLDYPSGMSHQDFRVFGNQLVIDDLNGATQACPDTAVLYYWGVRPPVAEDADVSLGTYQEDIACIYYALHRWYRMLASNRVHFTRYSTLLGANASSISDLQNESDRLLQDFRDARDDLPPLQPASFYPSSRLQIGL